MPILISFCSSNHKAVKSTLVKICGATLYNCLPSSLDIIFFPFSMISNLEKQIAEKKIANALKKELIIRSDEMIFLLTKKLELEK